jgi:hypothetical protein
LLARDASKLKGNKELLAMLPFHSKSWPVHKYKEFLRADASEQGNKQSDLVECSLKW